jgi:hypothetical protein
VDDPFGRQPIALGDFRLAGRATAQLPAFLEQFRPGNAMNRAVHTAAAQQGRVCRVHDHVHRLLRNIALDDFNPVLQCSAILSAAHNGVRM